MSADIDARERPLTIPVRTTSTISTSRKIIDRTSRGSDSKDIVAGKGEGTGVKYKFTLESAAASTRQQSRGQRTDGRVSAYAVQTSDYYVVDEKQEIT